MALFVYQALTPKGKKSKGFISAESIDDAKDRVSESGVFLTHIVLAKQKGMPLLSLDEVLIFTRELSKLLKAGLDLYEALVGLEEKHTGTKLQKVLLSIMEDVRMGKPLSKALQKHEKSFDSLYINMIQTAERSASLVDVLDEIEMMLSKQMALRKKLISSLTYPCLLGVFALGILSLLIFAIIPSLSELFEGRELHPFTQFVLDTSAFLNAHVMALLNIILFLLIALVSCYFSKTFKRLIRSFFIRVPFLKNLLIKMAFVRFCRSSATLLSAGVSVVDTLKLAKTTMKEPLLEKVLEKVRNGVLEGNQLSEEFKKSALVPHLVIRMISIAEDSATLPSMFKHIAQIFEEELDKKLHQLTHFLQPVLLLLISLVVGFTLLSVLLPLTDVSSLVTN